MHPTMKVVSFIFTSLFALARSDGSGDWVQEPTTGNWFKCLTFYDADTMSWARMSFDGANQRCNEAGGRALAAIHSKEEDDFIAHTLKCSGSMFGPPDLRNIGLRCVGAACKWNDGSPVDYTNFYGAGPPDDGATRCYTVPSDLDGVNNQWQQRGFPGLNGCPSEDSDAWICSMPPKAECMEGETAHNNGCVSVHLTPLDQKSADEACPGGGHLVSIHSYSESNNFYAKLAVDTGINGTVYIGGQFSKGAFEWTDGSYPNTLNWAKSFPNSVYGNCVQMMLATQFGAQGQWTNVDCATKQPYMCFRGNSV